MKSLTAVTLYISEILILRELKLSTQYLLSTFSQHLQVITTQFVQLLLNYQLFFFLLLSIVILKIYLRVKSDAFGEAQQLIF